MSVLGALSEHGALHSSVGVELPRHLGDLGDERFLPSDELVVLKVDVITGAAGLALVCLFVEFDKVLSGIGSMGN